MLNYITLMQIIGCILVIFGHSYPFMTDIPEWLINIRTFIYTFHMTLFVFCSGYLFKYTRQCEKYSFAEFTRKRARRILVPYFIFSVLGIIPKVLFSGILNDSLSFKFSEVIKAFLVPRNNIWGHFWFLPMIFFIGIIGYGIDKLSIKIKDRPFIWGGILIASVALSFVQFDGGKWIGINDIFLYFWFFALGVLSIELKLDSIMNKLSFGSLLIASGITLFVLNTAYDLISSLIFNKIIGVMMVFGIFMVCQSTSDKVQIPEKSPIKETYTMFILSWPCQLICEVILERILHMPICITLPMQFLAGIFITMLLIKIINKFEEKTKMHFLSFCLGR